ncbi:hypothetical protein PG1C_03710 [Rugosibacter aromaticivorans]|uniref:Uncharacterized protein n=1 Tax=Rugosibacter aromaticivorans TaxID=1565605 RepID=A0A0C5IYI5_9PROT|nr:hypothetical protein [Rugosibacter aromaticivorans]AJP47812.1 hypothetical protein PG1C_03710 [Rugosibacter aromaticivorans]TBR16166.1 MAG: hypothetical protein EPO43_01575 [Rugosibacter sp.]
MPDLIPTDDTARLLADADKLIQRRRVFIASPSQPVSPPVVETGIETVSHVEPTPHIAEHATADHDLPLLTERVTAPEPALADLQASQRDAVQKELAHWLEQELPATILKVTDGIADQLLGELTRKAEEHLLPSLMAHLGDQMPST